MTSVSSAPFAHAPAQLRLSGHDLFVWGCACLALVAVVLVLLMVPDPMARLVAQQAERGPLSALRLQDYLLAIHEARATGVGGGV